MKGPLIIQTIILFILLPLLTTAGCQGQPEPAPTLSPTPNPLSPALPEKVSGDLLTQINLRSEQIAHPTAERLEIMKNMGMMVDNLENQRVFIHLEHELNDAQVKGLQTMGLTLYLDSWIPPVGAHPTGYIIADMPINVLEELAEVDYIVKLDTAERQLQPQAVNQPKEG